MECTLELLVLSNNSSDLCKLETVLITRAAVQLQTGMEPFT